MIYLSSRMLATCKYHLLGGISLTTYQGNKKNRFLRFKKRLRNFIKLSWRVKLLLLGSLCIMGIVRLAILTLPFRYLTKFMGRKMAESPSQLNPKLLSRAVTVGWAVNKLSNFTPWESKCLVRSFTAHIILKLFKIPSTLYFGMAKADSNQLLAHAWLRCGNLTITGAGERKRFKTVAHFSTFIE